MNDIEQDDEDFIKDMTDGQAADSQIQNIDFKKTGKLIPRHTIPQITHYKKRIIVNDSDFGDLFNKKVNKDLNPTEHMMRYCRSKITTSNYYFMTHYFRLIPQLRHIRMTRRNLQ